MTIDGTDVSGWQSPTPNYGANQFVISKATEGVGYVNQNHAAQVAAARRAGLGVGHYHFANGLNTPEAEARYFWTHADWRSGEVLALDLEHPFYNPDPVGWSTRWLAEVHRLSGVWPLLYINGDWKNRYHWLPVVKLGVGLWLAAYNNVGPGNPSPWPFVAIWQNSNADETSGGDDNVFYGTLAQFRQYGSPGPNPRPKPKPKPNKPQAPAPKPKPKPQPPRVYVVRPGDTLTAIAAKLGTTVAHLVAVNGIRNPDYIQAGWSLKY